MFTPLVLYLSLFLSTLVHAVPFDKRDVWAPPITSPNANSVWPVGTKQTVTWDTSTKPAEVTNPIGRVVLGHVENNSLNLQLNNPLAQGFNLTDGKVQITVPDVPPREDYIVVLIGNSGNMSPTFAITSITGGSSSSGSGSASASSSAGSASASTSASFTSTAPAPEDTTSVTTLITNPIPITGTTITGGVSSSVAPVSSITSPAASSATPTSPSSSSISSLLSSALSGAAASSASASTSASGTAEGAQSSTSTSGALSLFQGQGALCVGMVSLVVALAI